MFKTKSRFVCIALAIAASAFCVLGQGQKGPNAPGLYKLICFDGASNPDIYGGECTLGTGSERDTATLSITADDPDGSYAGVYSNRNFIAGKPLEELSDLKFSYTGTVTPISYGPQFRIPIDMNGDGSTEIFMFVVGAFCNDGAGHVDVTGNPDCFVFDTRSSRAHFGYAAYLAANPGFRVATDNYPFVATYGQGTLTISGVSFGRPGNR